MTKAPLRLSRITLLVLLLAPLAAGRWPSAVAQSGRSGPQGGNTVTGPSVPAPEAVLGFKIGTDRRLAKWEALVAYFRRLAEASDRIKVDELGKTTLGRPFILATISSPANLARLAELKEVQRRLADPRIIDREAGQQEVQSVVEKLIQSGKTIVVITCSIHSTEVGGTMMGTELAYRLSSENTPEIQKILDETVVLLVPSLNPDGTDIVANWYEKTRGTPAEGTSPPELYHHYTGHDNNRDWYAFTQVETQLTVDRVLNQWHPQIVHDVHQMGSNGARLFLPPYVEPWEPNVDPAIIAGVSALGSTMAWDCIAMGLKGIVINGVYDAWTPARAYAHYHGGLRILSEAASARLATPIEVPFERLGPGINYHAAKETWNFPSLWKGGKWTLRDIVNYQEAAAFALLTHAARYRADYLRSFYEVSRRAVSQPPSLYAYLLLEPAVPSSIAEGARRLKEGLKGVSGTEGEKHEAAEALTKSVTQAPSTAEEVVYYLKTEGLDRLISILRRGGVEILQASEPFAVDGVTYPAGTRIVPLQQPYGAFAKTLLEAQHYPDIREYPGGPPRRPYDVTAHTLPLLLNVEAIPVKAAFKSEAKPEPYAVTIQSRVRKDTRVRVAIYQSYAPSMDEGWTRWVFDQYHFPYQTVHDRDVRAGELKIRYDVIILPDESARLILDGTSARSERGEGDGEGGRYPEEYAGGLGKEGVKALSDFVAAGGTLVTLNNASNFAIEQLGAPVRNVLKGIAPKDFYCPGSILRTHLDDSSPLTLGLEKESIAWFEGSPAFEITDPAAARAIATYSDRENPLLSGWILGDKLIRGKAALVEARIGKGRIILFGFRPQYRGQSLATWPMLFNAVLTAQ
jgi:hypothetical protein